MESHDAEFSEAGRGCVPAPKQEPDVTVPVDEPPSARSPLPRRLIRRGQPEGAA